MMGAPEDDDELHKRLVEEYKKARRKDNAPVYVHQKDKWDLPPEDDALGPQKEGGADMEKPKRER